MSRILTIAIPTYNRAHHVGRLIDQLIKHRVTELAEILVIDDGGGDNTYEQLISRIASYQDSISIHRNETNLGYPQTLVRLFLKCRTKYLLAIADDDNLITESVKPLLEFLASEKPDFVSPQFIANCSIYRGKAENRKIRPSEFHECCRHAPGLVYNVPRCNIGLGLLARRIRENTTDALVYPCLLYTSDAADE